MKISKLKRIIKEELLKYKIKASWGRYELSDLYKNPPTIRNFPDGSRGLTTPSGDLYFVDGLNGIIHDSLINYIVEYEGYSQQIKNYTYWGGDLNKKFVCWQKYESNVLYLGESTIMDTFNEFYKNNSNGFKDYIDNLSIKHPNIKFNLEAIDW